jgi:hypothetical protein
MKKHALKCWALALIFLAGLNLPAFADSATVPPAQTVTISVTFDGSLPVTYQWHKDGADLPGATNATLVLTNVTPADSGTYTVTVTNGAGSTLSDNATLLVLIVPSNVKTHVTHSQ